MLMIKEIPKKSSKSQNRDSNPPGLPPPPPPAFPYLISVQHGRAIQQQGHLLRMNRSASKQVLIILSIV